MARISEDERAMARKMLARFCAVHESDGLVARLFDVGPGRVFGAYCQRMYIVDPIAEYVDPPARAEMWAARYVEQNRSDVRHVVDWLRVAADERHAWIDNVDHLGRPKKLMKCGDLQRLVYEADKAMRHRQQVEDRVVAINALTSADERWVRDLGAGYHLVRLLSLAALDAEGRAMRNCIGHGAYDDMVLYSNFAYYSVRDSNGKRHATIEVFAARDEKLIIQFEGPGNTRPEPHIIDLVDGVRGGLGWLKYSEVPDKSIWGRLPAWSFR